MSADINERKIISYVSQEERMKKINAPAAAAKTVKGAAKKINVPAAAVKNVKGAVKKETAVRHEHRENPQKEQTIDFLSKVIVVGMIMIILFSLPVLFLPFLAISGFFMM